MTFTVQLPDVGQNQAGVGSTPLRYEDVAQDGRLRLEGVWPPIGPILWGKLDFARVLARLGAQGIRAVLTHVVLEGSDEPVSVRRRVETEVRYRLAHTVDADGAISRIVFDTWLELRAPRAIPGRPHEDPTGPPIVAARGYGQHVFTRPAAPPGQHRVTEISDPEVAPIVERTHLVEPSSLSSAPPGAVLLDEVPWVEPTPVVFGLCHTDGNQHVNFLTYPRIAEEVAIRRFAQLSLNPRVLARRAEVCYRKPCFAGDSLRVLVQAFQLDGQLGAIVAFVGGEPTGMDPALRPHAVARLWFR